MKSNGDDIVNITQDSLDDRWPRISPDGRWISYIVTLEKTSSIWLMRLDGTDKHKISDDKNDYLLAEWFPSPKKR